jgi:hypothetical protein
MKDLEINNIFVAAPYSGFGHVVSTALGYYLKTNKSSIIDLLSVDQLTGKAEASSYVEQDFSLALSAKTDNPEKITICIIPDTDDELTISKIIYHQHFKQWIVDNPVQAVEQWPELAGQLSDPQLTETAFLSDLDSKVYIAGWRSIDTSQIDLAISFKTLMGIGNTDLHQVLVDFLETTKDPLVEDYINQYHAANLQYLP